MTHHRLFPPRSIKEGRASFKALCLYLYWDAGLLIKQDEFDEALDAVNASEYGLQAGVFTKDIEKAFSAFNRLEVGGVLIGEIPTFRVDNYPYGGVKKSGFGREGVRCAVEEMTEIKVLVVPNMR